MIARLNLSWQADLTFRDEVPTEQARGPLLTASWMGRMLGSNVSMQLPGQQKASREALTRTNLRALYCLVGN